MGKKRPFDVFLWTQRSMFAGVTFRVEWNPSLFAAICWNFNIFFKKMVVNCMVFDWHFLVSPVLTFTTMTHHATHIVVNTIFILFTFHLWDVSSTHGASSHKLLLFGTNSQEDASPIITILTYSRVGVTICPNKLCFLLCNPLPRVALGPCIKWTL